MPICVEAIQANGKKRPLLVLENLTTFDTLRRWNAQYQYYSAVAYGGGTAFVSSCGSLSSFLAGEECSGQLLYFGDVDPKGLWIPVRASREIGKAIQADEGPYTLLFQKARRKPSVQRESLVHDPGLLDWLPAALREPAAQYFDSGRRLLQDNFVLRPPDVRIWNAYALEQVWKSRCVHVSHAFWLIPFLRYTTNVSPGYCPDDHLSRLLRFPSDPCGPERCRCNR